VNTRTGLLLFTLQLSYAQLPDGAELNKQSTNAAKRFRSLQFISESTVEMLRPDADPMKMTSEARTTMENPGKFAIESNPQGISAIIVSNADAIYMYMPSRHEYSKVPASAGPAALMASFGMKLPDFDSLHQSPKTLRDETIEVGNKNYDCWVVENKIGDLSMPLPGADTTPIKMKDFQITMWIDKKLLIEVRQDASMKMDMAGVPSMAMHLITVKRNLKVDEPVDESKFVFTPPADAKEVKEFGFAMGLLPKADLVGKDAASFEVKAIDGKPYSLAALKGKTVMLDFWATWCGPCRDSMPSTEKIFADHKDRGLVVLGVNVAEDRDIVDAFVKKHSFTYPIVMSGESTILTDYKINAYPTFVLIEDGKVIAQQIGFRGESSLRNMFEKSKLALKR
jgi:thiol-disulfide isomerase/thioredoxin